MMVPEEITIVRGNMGGIRRWQHKIIKRRQYMPTITNNNMSSDEESDTDPQQTTDNDSASGMVENGTSTNSSESLASSSSASTSSTIESSTGGGEGSGRVWMSSVPASARGTPPREYNDLLAINKQLIRIIERCDGRTQIMMDDAQSKRRGAKKNKGRRGKNLLLKNNGLAQFDLMVSVKVTEFVRCKLLPNTKFLADGWHIYSETAGTLSQMCLKYLKDVMGADENPFQYWNNELVPVLNYKMITAKSESGQGFKKQFQGEDIICYFLNFTICFHVKTTKRKKFLCE